MKRTVLANHRQPDGALCTYIDQFHYVIVGETNPFDVVNDVFHALVDAGIMSRSLAHETVLKWVLEQLEKEGSNESPQTH